MKRNLIILFTLLVIVSNTSCSKKYDTENAIHINSRDHHYTYDPDNHIYADGENDGHEHKLNKNDNQIEIESDIDFENTETRLQKGPFPRYGYIISVNGKDVDKLLNILYKLDYTDDICNCYLDFKIDNEDEEPIFGINIRKGFVRHNNKQVQLTKKQVNTISDLLYALDAQGELIEIY